MIAVTYERHGDPSQVLRAVEVRKPAPGPREVLVQLEASTVAPADLATVRGVYRTPQKLPAVPGYEGLGRVVEVGSEVRAIRTQQRVLILPFKKAGWINGTWQEFICTAETEVFPIPEQVDGNIWAQFFNTIVTPWIMTVDELKLGHGQTLLLTAAGSTVGQVTIQIAKLMGFSVIAVVRRPEQVEFIKKLGADEVICSASEDVTQRALTLTQLKGVTAVMDAVGGTVATQCFRALADRGTMFVYGLLALEREAPVDLRKMLFYNLSLRGFWLPDWWFSTPMDRRSRIINTVLDHVAKENLSAPVETTYRLSDIQAAVKKAETPGNRGRIILSPG